MDELTIEVEPTERATVVRVAGHGSLQSAQALQHALVAVVQAKPAIVVLDLSQLTFVSSLCMGTLVQFRGQIKAQGGSVRLASLPPQVAEAFERARLLWVFPVFDTVERALSIGRLRR